MKLDNISMHKINGGTSLSASMIEGISRLFTTVFSIGQSIGSAVRRLYSKDLC